MKQLILFIQLVALTSLGLAYQPPVPGPVTFTTHSNYFDYQITDPVTNAVQSGSTPVVQGAPKNYATYVTPDGMVYYSATSFDNVFGGERNYIGAAVYDPAVGQWKKQDYTYLSSNGGVAANAGIFASVVNHTDASNHSWTTITMATFEPDSHSWVGYTHNLQVGIEIHGNATLVNKDGVVAWSYATDSGLNHGYVHCAIYDPVRKQWKTRQEYTDYDNVYAIENGTLICYPFYTGGVRTLIGYNYDTGAWEYYLTTKPISSFRTQRSYAANAPSTAWWASDMSVGASRSLNWGDGATISGSGYHIYSSNFQQTLTQTVTGWNGATATSSYTINQNYVPVPSIEVDNYPSGFTITRPYGGSATITVRYKASDQNGDLAGIRYNIWNSSTGYFDNGGGAMLPQSGSYGEVVRTVSLNQNGDWYFWTDAQDAQGAYANTPPWGEGFKITVTEAPAELTPDPNSVLVNLSTRGVVGSGENTMIGGFVLSGSISKNILVNGRGPSLANYGVTNAITDPFIGLNGSGGSITTNDDWQMAPNASEIISSGYAPANSKEASILRSLGPGAYTVTLNNLGGGSTGLFELYDLTGGTSSKLVNVATRGYVGTGDGVLIVGFVISNGNKRVLINGKGPSLSGGGISNPLANPIITLNNSGGAQIKSNDNWQNAWNASAINTLPYHPTNSNEASIYEVLPPGVYTVVLQGVSSGTGVGLIEVYDMP